MGMRQFESRWFRSPDQIEHRLWINNATSSSLTKRLNELELVQSLSVLSAETLLELWRIRDAERQRYRDENYWRMRCPVCGGWAVYGTALGSCGGLHVIPRCRDCGWPAATQICGSNIIVPNPRTGFRLSGCCERIPNDRR